MLEDFDIEAVAGGAQRPTINIYNVSVTNNMLDIRLQFAGKGTTRIPKRGVYGPIISAVSISSGHLNTYFVKDQSRSSLSYLTCLIVFGMVSPLQLIKFARTVKSEHLATSSGERGHRSCSVSPC